jgi:hypothetical protein
MWLYPVLIRSASPQKLLSECLLKSGSLLAPVSNLRYLNCFSESSSRTYSLIPLLYNVHLEGRSVQTYEIRSSEASATITSRPDETFHKTLIFGQVAVHLVKVIIQVH